MTRLYGAGRVFYLSSEQTWRWRYKVADRFHARFWNQLLAAVMQPPYSASDDYVALGTDKIEYEAGESSIIRVRLQDTGGKPVGDATVDALLIADDRIDRDGALGRGRSGTWHLPGTDSAAGSRCLRCQDSGQRIRCVCVAGHTPIWVGERDSSELGRVSLDENALGAGDRGGGRALLS